jgi:hypothetical protein
MSNTPNLVDEEVIIKLRSIDETLANILTSASGLPTFDYGRDTASDQDPEAHSYSALSNQTLADSLEQATGMAYYARILEDKAVSAVPQYEDKAVCTEGLALEWQDRPVVTQVVPQYEDKAVATEGIPSEWFSTSLNVDIPDLKARTIARCLLYAAAEHFPKAHAAVKDIQIAVTKAYGVVKDVQIAVAWHLWRGHSLARLRFIVISIILVLYCICTYTLQEDTVFVPT